jgi:hypothetical protein
MLPVIECIQNPNILNNVAYKEELKQLLGIDFDFAHENLTLKLLIELEIWDKIDVIKELNNKALQEQKLKESAKVKVETQELLTSLKRTGLGQEIDLLKTASKWQQSKFLGPIAEAILNFFQAKNPEILALRDQLKTLNLHFWSYAKLMMTGKPEVRREAWNGLKTVREEKKRLKQQIRALKEKDAQMREAETKMSGGGSGVAGITGWVLAFYLATYFITYPLTIKQFSLPALPKNFYFYQSQITTGLTIFLFLLFSALTLRNFWLKKFAGASLILYPLTLFGFLLFAINLL